MSVLLYKGAKYRTLAGKKIFRNGKWIALPASAKMYLNGQWYPLGRTVPGSSIPDIPDMPEAPEITHINGEEPSGKKWYISPAGSGAQDGTSWADSAPQSMIHVIMLQCTSGDSVYFTEGNYTTDRVIVLPAGVSFYGGFAEDNPAWDTRDGFKHPTLFTGDGSYDFVEGGNAVDGQTLDGISAKGYANAVSNGEQIVLRNGTFEDAPVTCAKAEYCVFNRTSVTCSGDLLNCNIFYAKKVTASGNAARLYVCGDGNSYTYSSLTCNDLSKSTLFYVRCTAGDADQLYAYNSSVSCNKLTGGTFSHATLDVKSLSDVTCYYSDVSSSEGPTQRLIVHGNNNNYVSVQNASDCEVIACHPRYKSGSSGVYYMFGGDASNCTVRNIESKASGSVVLFDGNASNCRVVSFYRSPYQNSSYRYTRIFEGNAVNCLCEGFSSTDNPENTVFYGGAQNCVVTNCSGKITLFRQNAEKCTAVNCNCGEIFLQEGRNCTVLNCRATGLGYIGSVNPRAVNSVFVNCSDVSSYLFPLIGSHCAVVNSSIVGETLYYQGSNNVSWNNDCVKEYSGSTTCAGSVYTDDLALTLGYDNTIARFTNTGYYPAQGVQDVGDCPSPVDDPDGFKSYVAAFGDWHPLSNSFLIGKGTALDDVSTDLDGVTRPVPPTIGAYEPRPE